MAIGIENISFGLSVPIGKASSSQDEFEFTNDELTEINNQVILLRTKYSDISINKFIDIHSISHLNSRPLACSAGKTNIVVSENGYVRPCLYLPQSIFDKIDIMQYTEQIIEKGHLEDYTNAINKFEEILSQNEKSFLDMKCVGFCNIK